MAQPSLQTTPDLTHISEEAWSKARKRLAAIQPLLTAEPVSKEVAKRHAECAGVHVSTLYRWLEAYRKTEQLTALLPEKPGGEPGQKRLPARCEEIVSLVIEQIYLTRQRPSVRHVITEIIRRCRDAGLAVPHRNTIRRRIERIPEQVEAERRDGSQAARVYEPLADNFPMPESALSVVQIDHTKVDIILVDDLTRQPVGRPWITLAIDVFSRMIAGFYVSFDPPRSNVHGLVPGSCHSAEERLVSEIRNYDTLADLRTNSETAPRQCEGIPRDDARKSLSELWHRTAVAASEEALVRRTY
jgi:putative transposase